jgi:hypothetical protein
MLISTPPTIVPGSLQNPGEAALYLRVNQHIAGEVIRVENEQVVLSIQGVQVVARMSTPEQTASLVERRFAQFIVRDMSGELLTLQLVDPGSIATPQTVIKSDSQLLPKLLTQLGIADGPGNQIIAQAAIHSGLTITPALIQELQSVLGGIPNWGMEQAQAAALLKSCGLPPTPDSINLILHTPPEISGQLQDLIQQLAQVLANSQLPVRIQEQVQNSLQILSQAVVDPSLPTGELSSRIQNAIILLGKSVENELLNTSRQIGNDNNANNLERGLMVLSRLRNELVSQGMTKLAGLIDQFNDSIRLMHLYHSSSSDGSSTNQWIRLEIPVNFPVLPQETTQEQNEKPTARVRVARDPDSDGLSVNPRYTRLVISMDINDQDVIEVDLSVVDHAAGLSISTSNTQLTTIARAELPELCEDLLQSGYDTKISQVETRSGLPDMADNVNQSQKPLFTSINLEA